MWTCLLKCIIGLLHADALDALITLAVARRRLQAQHLGALGAADCSCEDKTHKNHRLRVGTVGCGNQRLCVEQNGW